MLYNLEQRTINMIKEVNSENFKTEVLDSELPVVVDFNAKWCGPCRKMMPMLEELSDSLADKVKFVKIDASANKELLTEYLVSGLPNLLIFKNGKSLERIAGVIPKSTIISNVEKYI
jgi:thioredoxin 1